MKASRFQAPQCVAATHGAAVVLSLHEKALVVAGQPAEGDIIAGGTSEMSESVGERCLYTPGMI